MYTIYTQVRNTKLFLNIKKQLQKMNKKKTLIYANERNDNDAPMRLQRSKFLLGGLSTVTIVIHQRLTIQRKFTIKYKITLEYLQLIQSKIYLPCVIEKLILSLIL